MVEEIVDLRFGDSGAMAACDLHELGNVGADRAHERFAGWAEYASLC